jgi:AcrR family transcriptional regulator
MLKKQTKKEKILDAAFMVYREAGFVNVRMEDIAKRAGVGKGTMYQYFPSKEALLEATVENCILSYTLFLEEIFISKDDFETCLFKWVEFHREAMRQSDGMMELMHSEGFTLSKTMKAQLQTHRDKLYQLMDLKIRESIATNKLPGTTDSTLVLALLFGTITHYYFPECRKNKLNHLETQDFVTHMMKLLRVPL